MTRIALIASIVALPFAAAADEDATTQDMLPACTRATDLSLSASDLGAAGVFCLNVARSVANVLEANCQFAQQGGEIPFGWIAAARPGTMSNAAVVQAFVNWANAHPEAWGEGFSQSIARALSETFPCEAG